jgi:hypothetical protein
LEQFLHIFGSPTNPKAGVILFFRPESVAVQGQRPACAGDQPAAFSTASPQVVSDAPVITVDAPPSDVEPMPPGLQFPITGIPVCDRLLLKTERELSSRLPSGAVRQVRPEVKEFLRQVVVPILVERYIASLNQKKLAARALEAE